MYSDALGEIRPAAVHVGRQRDRRADEAPVQHLVPQEFVEICRQARRVHDRDAAHLARGPDDRIAVAQVLRAGPGLQVGVVDEARDRLAGEALHIRLELEDLLRRLGHGTADVDDVPDLELARLERGEIAVIARERHRARGIAADVEDDQIPVLREGAGDRGAHIGLRQARAREGLKQKMIF